jgi:hypothetical protein
MGAKVHVRHPCHRMHPGDSQMHSAGEGILAGIPGGGDPSLSVAYPNLEICMEP